VKAALQLDEVFPELELITDDALRIGVNAVWQELWAASAFDSLADVPTSPEISYPHVAHNRSVVTIALAIADTFEKFHEVTVDRDILISAALLQDVSKLVEYEPTQLPATQYSELGRTYPHAFIAAHVALKHGLPDAVCHIILSHTPQSASFPASLEGKILYYADQLDVLAIYRDRWEKHLFITK
jgi:HD domain